MTVPSKHLIELCVGDLRGEHIWCDEIPMTTIHILLERPWIYDKGNTHDIRTNTQTFYHKD